MIVGGVKFEIRCIEQQPVTGGMFGTVIECIGDSAPVCHDSFMTVTETGISVLDGQEFYIGKLEMAKGKVFIRLVARELLSLVEKR